MCIYPYDLIPPYSAKPWGAKYSTFGWQGTWLQLSMNLLVCKCEIIKHWNFVRNLKEIYLPLMRRNDDT